MACCFHVFAPVSLEERRKSSQLSISYLLNFHIPAIRIIFYYVRSRDGFDVVTASIVSYLRNQMLL